MIKIKSLNDLELLRNSHTLPDSFIDYLRRYFLELAETLGKYSDPKDAPSIHDYNTFNILEPTDKPLQIEELGMQEYENKLIACWEFCNLLKFEDFNAYHVGVLYDNESMGIFYSLQGQFDTPIESVFEEYAIS